MPQERLAILVEEAHLACSAASRAAASALATYSHTVCAAQRRPERLTTVNQ